MKSPVNRFRPVAYPLMVLAYASYFLSKMMFIILGVPLYLLATPSPALRQRLIAVLMHHYLGFFTRVWLPLLRIYTIAEISGREKIETARPAIIVANHRSFMDSLFLLGLSPLSGALTKSSYSNQPMYQLMIRRFDLVSVDRNSVESVAVAFTRCREILAANKNLIVFPEGTRARGKRLQPFNRLAFDVALAAQAAVLPVVIHSTEPIMAKIPGSIFPRRRIFFRIRFLDPEKPRPEDTAGELSDRVHRRIAQELKILDAGTSWETNPSTP